MSNIANLTMSDPNVRVEVMVSHPSGNMSSCLQCQKAPKTQYTQLVCIWRIWWQFSKEMVSLPQSVQVCQSRPISPEPLAEVHLSDPLTTRAVDILASKHDVVTGG